MLARVSLLSVLLLAGPVQADPQKPAPPPAAAPAPAQKVLASTAAAPQAAAAPQSKAEALKKKVLDTAAAGQCDEAKELAMRMGDAALTAQVEKACAR